VEEQVGSGAQSVQWPSNSRSAGYIEF
jgi:hypothetical protein